MSRKLGLTRNDKRIRIYTNDSETIGLIHARFPDIHFTPYHNEGRVVGYVSKEAPKNPDRQLSRLAKYVRELEIQGHRFGI